MSRAASRLRTAFVFGIGLLVVGAVTAFLLVGGALQSAADAIAGEVPDDLEQSLLVERRRADGLERRLEDREAALRRLRDELAGMRAENGALAARVSAREDQRLADPKLLALAESYRTLEAPLAWLRQLLPERYGDMTPQELFHLREVDLTSSAVTDDDLQNLQSLPSLRTVQLRRTAITDAGLEHLQSIPKLEKLGLRETKVTDEGMDAIARLRNLRWLDLNMLPITDPGFDKLRGLTNLRFLRLNYTKVGNRGLQALRDFAKLERLDLWGTSIDDRCELHLWSLPSLEHLELGATSISKSWVGRFQATHPACYVRSRWGK